MNDQRYNQFQRGRGVYTCISCERDTRGNQDSAQCELCAECFELAGLDNQINDDGRALTFDELTWRDELLAKIVKRGGDPEQVKDLNDYLWPGYEAPAVKLRHEGHAVGERVRAYDFEPREGVGERYAEGVIIELCQSREMERRGFGFFYAYRVRVDVDTVFTDNPRPEVYVPYETALLEWDGRVARV